MRTLLCVCLVAALTPIIFAKTDADYIFTGDNVPAGTSLDTGTANAHAIYARSASDPSLPVDPLISLYKPLDGLTQAIVQPFEAIIRKGEDSTEIQEQKLTEEIHTKLSSLIAQPVFIKYSVAGVSLREAPNMLRDDDPTRAAEIRAKYQVILDSIKERPYMIKCRLLWQSEPTLSRPQRKELEDREKTLSGPQGGYSSNLRIPEAEVRHAIESETKQAMQISARTRPFQVAYILSNNSDVEKLKIGDIRMARGVIGAAAAFFYYVGGAYQPDTRTYVGVEYEVLEDARKPVSSVPRKPLTPTTLPTRSGS